jgi:hypothetical protein
MKLSTVAKVLVAGVFIVELSLIISRIPYGSTGTSAIQTKATPLRLTNERRSPLIFVYPIPQVLRLSLVLKYTNFSLTQDDLQHPDCSANGYSIEQNFVDGLHHDRFAHALTENPENADLFFIPILPVCLYHTALRKGFDSSDASESVGSYLEAVIKFIRRRWIHFEKSHGHNHIIPIAHDSRCFGPFSKILQFTRKMIMISPMGQISRHSQSQKMPHHVLGPVQQAEKNEINGCVQFHRDVVVPAKLSLNVQKQFFRLSEVPLSKRKYVLSFCGTLTLPDDTNNWYSFGIRTMLSSELKGQPDVWFEQKATDEAIVHAMMNSKFCLYVYGWNPWSSRLAWIIQAGCIPVIVSDGVVMPFERSLDWSRFAIKINHADAVKPGFLLSYLRKYSSVRAEQKFLNFKEVQSKLVFHDPPEIEDSMQLVLEELKLIKQAMYYSIAWDNDASADSDELAAKHV